MPTATWDGRLIAKADKTIRIEGNHYFDPADVDRTLLVESPTQTVCPWKGTAHYYHIDIDGNRNADAVWYYPDPKPAAEEIRGRMAFWRGVSVGE